MAVKDNALPPDARFDPASDSDSIAAFGDDAPDVDSDAVAIQNTVKRMLEEAVRHYEEELEPEQVLATDYYHGEPFGDEREGRSKVVSTDVRDATLAQMPSIMEIIFGPDRVVEFKPRGPEDEELAQQQTDGCNYIVCEENDGYTLFHDWVQDGLVRKIGVVKAWWSKSYRVEVSEHTGLTEEEIAVLAQDDLTQEFEITGAYPLSGAPGAPMLYNVTVTRRSDRGCVKVRAIPSEEFVFTPNARTLDDAPLVAHIREVPADELIGMGIDEDLVRAAQGKTKATDTEDLQSTREYHDVPDFDKGDARDESQKPVLYAEAYALVDGDGDGIGERRLFQCIGPDYEIVNGDGFGEIVDDMVPFAVWSPYRRAHTLVGDSNYDLAKDIQRVSSQVWRGTLDSLAQSITPITEVVRGEVNMADLLNPDVDKIVRVERPGMMREVKTSFVGPDTLPVLALLKETRDDRLGTSRASMGLDADVLQSTTKAAVSATMSGAQQRLKFVVRALAETGMKRLFRIVCAIMVKHPDRVWMMKLRGKWVPVNPAHWDATMDVQVNVGIGQGTPQERVEQLAGMLGAQKELMAMGAPFVSWAGIRRALDRVTDQSGFKSSDDFFEPWGAEDDKRMQEMKAQQPPPPDPNMALVQIEQTKAQHEAMLAEKKFELERWKATMEDDRARDKIARDAALKERELELKHQVEIEDAHLRAQVARQRAELDADIKREQVRTQPTTEAA